MNSIMSITSTSILALLTGLLIGCGTNQGQQKSYPLESRTRGESPQLGSVDLVTASEQAVVGIAETLAREANENQNEGEDRPQTVIVMDRVENQTSDPTADFQIYLARIRALLNQSGARQNMVFVESPEKAAAIKRREGYPVEDSNRTRPDYALTATFYDMPRGGTNYYLLAFQLFNFSNDQIVWEDRYEVKL